MREKPLSLRDIITNNVLIAYWKKHKKTQHLYQNTPKTKLNQKFSKVYFLGPINLATISYKYWPQVPTNKYSIFQTAYDRLNMID